MIKVISILLSIFTIVSVIATFKGTNLHGVEGGVESHSVRASHSGVYSSTSSSGWTSGK